MDKKSLKQKLRENLYLATHPWQIAQRYVRDSSPIDQVMAEHKGEKVIDFWRELVHYVPLASPSEELESFRETIDRGYYSKGYEGFWAIKSVVDDQLQECEDLDFMVTLFDKGPWNIPEIGYIQEGLSVMNEYSNTVGYIQACALERLGQLGEQGKKEVRKLAEENDGFRGHAFHLNGGNLEPRIWLDEIVENILE